jgi:hypothetical protein
MRLMGLIGAIAFGGCQCDESLGQLRATIEVMPKELNFGQVPINSSKELELTIRNLGTFQLTISQFNAMEPFIPPAGTATVGTGSQTRTVHVGFRPTALGPQSGTLTIATDDPDAPIVEVPLKGAGIEAAITVEPSAIDFGDVMWTTMGTPVRREVTVSNPGSDSFQLTTLELVENGGGQLMLDARNAKGTYGPGDSNKFEVSYLPNMRGPVTGSVRLVNTTRAAPEIVIPLSGKGVGPEIAICAGVDGGTDLCTTAGERPKVDFRVDRMATGQGHIKVSNIGDRDLTISQAQVTGLASEFAFVPAIDGMTPYTIPPGQELTWQVAYGPADYDFDSIIVSFFSNSSVRGNDSVRVEGRIKRAKIEVEPRSLTFRLSGAVTRNRTPVRIKNCGDYALVIGSDVTIRQLTGPAMALSLENAPRAGAMVMPQNCMVDPPGLEFFVVFETMTNGNYSAEVTIPSNDPTEPSVTVMVGATKS